MKPLKETIEGYADLKRQVEALSKRLNVLTRMEAVEVDQNGTTKFLFGDSKAILSVRTGDKEGVAEKTNDYNNTEKNSVTDSEVAENTEQTTTNEGALQKLLDETYGGESEDLPWDLDLYGQSSGSWSFAGTVPGPLSSPNSYSAKFYLVGNVLYGYSHSSNADDGLNIFNEYVRIEGVDTSWLNIRLNDRGLTFTSEDTKTLSSGTYTVRWNGSGSDWEFEFSVTVP